MRYRLVFDKKYRVSGRYTVNMQGTLVVFTDGVAYVSNKDVADYARKMRFIATVEDISPPVVVETVLPEIVEKPPVVVAPPVPAESEVEKPKDENEEPPVDEVKEPEKSEEETTQPTAEEITALYESLGTWTAVAKHFDVSTATLRKYREDAGLL